MRRGGRAARAAAAPGAGAGARACADGRRAGPRPARRRVAPGAGRGAGGPRAGAAARRPVRLPGRRPRHGGRRHPPRGARARLRRDRCARSARARRRHDRDGGAGARRGDHEVDDEVEGVTASADWTDFSAPVSAPRAEQPRPRKGGSGYRHATKVRQAAEDSWSARVCFARTRLRKPSGGGASGGGGFFQRVYALRAAAEGPGRRQRARSPRTGTRPSCSGRRGRGCRAPCRGPRSSACGPAACAGSPG